MCLGNNKKVSYKYIITYYNIDFGDDSIRVSKILYDRAHKTYVALRGGPHNQGELGFEIEGVKYNFLEGLNIVFLELIF